MTEGGTLNLPYIPEVIRVHLGPPESDAQTIEVDFPSYIKNVVSSEIYPTWPLSALRANIFAIISFALNRIYTDYYQSRGYDFDITSDTAIDQSYIPGKDIYANINELVDELFNSYVRKAGTVEPYFTQYCNGTTSTCEGLSQWGTVTLANEGLNSIEILRNYYGDDIEIVTDAPVAGSDDLPESVILRFGSAGNEVTQVQIRLNRISKNYPEIPKISPVDGVFNEDTEAAVRAFQRIFNLVVDVLVGTATWYAIQRVYNAVKRLNDLASEGITPDEVTNLFVQTLEAGSTGGGVRELQYLLNFVAAYEDFVPYVTINGIFDEQTKEAVEDFQRANGLTPDGIVDVETWDYLYRAYRGLLSSLPEDYFNGTTLPYPGYPLRLGMQLDSVRLIQEYLDLISTVYPDIAAPVPSGVYDLTTRDAVEDFQLRFGLNPTGVVSFNTWDAITSLYRDIYNGNLASGSQNPGTELSVETSE